MWKEGPSFEMFSIAHFAAIGALFFVIFLLFLSRKKWSIQPLNLRRLERLFALSLLIVDVFYYIWLVQAGRWNISNSLPLELCSISLLMTIFLLWTGNKHIYDFVFYAGIGGAIQAVATPVLDMGFPHSRFFHFFYTHIGIVITALYFTWVKGYRPTFKGIIKTIIALNILLPIVFAFNIFLKGNYMFLRMKPTNRSLLDFLGPYPWYILSLEVVAFSIFVILWLVFREKKERAET